MINDNDGDQHYQQWIEYSVICDSLRDLGFNKLISKIDIYSLTGGTIGKYIDLIQDESKNRISLLS
jgi:hypothetical protein